MYAGKGVGECGILLLNTVYMAMGNYLPLSIADNRNNHYSKRKQNLKGKQKKQYNGWFIEVYLQSSLHRIKTDAQVKLQLQRSKKLSIQFDYAILQIKEKKPTKYLNLLVSKSYIEVLFLYSYEVGTNSQIAGREKSYNISRVGPQE